MEVASLLDSSEPSSLLMYGTNAFSPLLTANQLDRLQVMQNRAARAVFGLSHHTSARTLLLQLDTYRVSEIFRQKFIVLVWRSRNGHASSDLQALLLSSFVSWPN
eukprot:scpid22861/ scgid13992/ 